MSKLSNFLKMFLETYSASYSEKVANNYWSICTKTHTDMCEAQFEFYFNNILEIINPKGSDLILDYGCGSGEISYLFHKNKYKIDCCDLSKALIEKAKLLGLSAFTCEEVINNTKKYDIIFINNAFFYIHPTKRKDFLLKLSQKLTDNGKLYILDEPDFNKRQYLNLGSLNILVSKVLPVYQVNQGGFYNKINKTIHHALSAGYTRAETLDSWSNYRSHIILYK